MENEKNTNFGHSEEEEFSGDSSSRARNRTVMLTPEITGEVRARLAEDLAKQSQEGDSGFTAPQPTFSSAQQPSGSSYAPASGASQAPQPPQPTMQQPVGAGAVVQQHAGEGVMWSKESKIVGFLVSYDANENGTVFELRTGRLIVTSEAAASGNFLVIDDETVSPMHAIMRISAGGEIQVLDQLSEHGTKITRFGSSDEEELSGDKATIEHGDIVKFGERSFHVCVISVHEES